MSYSVIYGFSENKGLFTPCGSDDAPDFGYVKKKIDDFDANGKKIGSHDEIVFEKIGSHSIKEYINSFNDTTDIKKIFEKYQAGDISVLTRRVGEFVDSVGAPETLLDAKLMMMNGEKLYGDLPVDIKNKYDNSVDKFIEACFNGKIYEDFPQTGEKLDKANQDEIASLKAQLEELKGGVKYE